MQMYAMKFGLNCFWFQVICLSYSSFCAVSGDAHQILDGIIAAGTGS